MITSIQTVNFRRAEQSKIEKGLLFIIVDNNRDNTIIMDSKGIIIPECCSYTERPGIGLHNIEIGD